jgi:hypothetical protein
MALQKQDGDIHPILCEEIWSRCCVSCARLEVNTTPIHNEETKLFTSTCDNFIHTSCIRDGDSHCVKILTCFYDNLDTSDPNDPDVIIKIDISNAFNTTDRVFTLDVLSGRVSRDYSCGLKKDNLFLIVKPYLNYSVISKSCTLTTTN